MIDPACVTGDRMLHAREGYKHRFYFFSQITRNSRNAVTPYLSEAIYLSDRSNSPGLVLRVNYHTCNTCNTPFSSGEGLQKNAGSVPVLSSRVVYGKEAIACLPN